MCIAGVWDLQTTSFEIPWFLGWWISRNQSIFVVIFLVNRKQEKTVANVQPPSNLYGNWSSLARLPSLRAIRRKRTSPQWPYQWPYQCLCADRFFGFQHELNSFFVLYTNGEILNGGWATHLKTAQVNLDRISAIFRVENEKKYVRNHHYSRGFICPL